MPLADSETTRRLLDEIAAGRRAAIDELLARHRGELHGSVTLRMDRRLRSRLDPSDIVQDAQLEAAQRIDDYLRRRPMPFRLWLRKTAHERLVKLRERHIEAARRSVVRESRLPDHTSRHLARLLPCSRSSPSEAAIREETAIRVRQALEQLGESDREILVMRYIEKLSNPEIAAILDLAPATVSKRHGRALLRLERLLADEER